MTCCPTHFTNLLATSKPVGLSQKRTPSWDFVQNPGLRFEPPQDLGSQNCDGAGARSLPSQVPPPAYRLEPFWTLFRSFLASLAFFTTFAQGTLYIFPGNPIFASNFSDFCLKLLRFPPKYKLCFGPSFRGSCAAGRPGLFFHHFSPRHPICAYPFLIFP